MPDTTDTPPHPAAGTPPAPPLTSTYRLQVHAGFDFEAARRVVPYVARLGASHLYLSPITEARPGSTHGYDVVDPRHASPELGGDAGFRALVAEAHAHGLGIVVDVVPNHMGTGPHNPFWDDVLALGRESSYARWFDVDWDAPEGALRGRLLLPVLGDAADVLVERGELRLALEDGRVRVRYHEHSFPLDPRTLHRAFTWEHEYAFPSAESATLWRVVRDGLIVERGASLAAADAVRAAEAMRALVLRDDVVRAYVEWALGAFGDGDAGHWRLCALLDAQPYALLHWRRAAREINYRRFFDVNDLAALRVEDPAVFAGTHGWLLDRVADGAVDAVRIDHIDGLRDPAGYLRALRAALDARRPGVPIFVEKILMEDEALREDWPVDGTTGYEFANEVEGVFVSPRGRDAITDAYRRMLRTRGASFALVATRGKEHMLRTAFAAELRRLGRLLAPTARAAGVRANVATLAEAALQLIARLPVYRTYLRAGGAGEPPLVASDEDRALISSTLAHALGRGAATPDALQWVAGVLLGSPGHGVAAPDPRRASRRGALLVTSGLPPGVEFALRWQQTSGPATAKGIEDTALYRWFPLASLCEVGGEPDRPLDDAVGALHRANAARAARWRRSLLTTTTHDTKRSADVRARLDALSEIADEWTRLVARWRRRHAALHTSVRTASGPRAAPDANAEYLLYQMLVGVWPAHDERADDDVACRAALRARVEEYMLKAGREAKAQTSWTDPDADYEAAVARFVDALVTGDAGAPFRAELDALVARVAAAGRWTSLARTALQLGSPGVPDVYQGDERWKLTLVDPDNRRPVDFARAAALLDALDAGDADPLDGLAEGAPKVRLVRAGLALRRARPALVGAGAYLPLEAAGARAAHVVAFARVHEGEALVVVAPRLVLGLAADGAPPVGAEVWGDTVVRLPPALAGRRWANAPAGGTLEAGDALPVAEVLRTFPAALLVSETGPAPR